MGGVFISYRREDSQGEALHLSDDLKEHFGIDRIFMGVTGIEPGKDFRKVIENAVTTCDVLIVMIGKKWIDAVNEEGKRRLDDPKDFVRIETEAALHRDVPVIPVLVQGAGIPRPEQLPAEIEALAWRNAFELRHNRWSIDVAELVTALRKVVPGSSTISSEGNKSQRWWQTVPGILTAVGTAIAALISLIVALHQAGLFDGGSEQGLQPRVEIKPPHIESARNIPKLRQESSGKEAVTPSESIIEPIRPLAQPEPPPKPKAINLLSLENGGQVLVAPSDDWLQTIDGKEEEYTQVRVGEEAVFAFKNEQAATFNTLSMLIPKSGRNPKEFELLAGDESPVGPFRSIGKFQTQNQ